MAYPSVDERTPPVGSDINGTVFRSIGVALQDGLPPSTIIDLILHETPGGIPVSGAGFQTPRMFPPQIERDEYRPAPPVLSTEETWLTVKLLAAIRVGKKKRTQIF
jgi:hypothetical protein